MFSTLQQYLNGLKDANAVKALGEPLRAIADRLSSQALGSAGLVIKAGGGVLVKNGTAIDVLANGVPVRLAVNTDQAALVGTVTNATFNVFCFYLDSAGTGTTLMGTAGATLAQVKFPQTPKGKALIGYVRVNPTGTGDFVGGTTALDDGTVVPNAIYVNTQGAVDPSVLLGS
jgi:hypothetical protein